MEDLQLLIYIGIAVVVVVILIIKIFRDRAIKSKGTIKLQTERSAAKLGETIHGMVRVHPLKDIAVDSIELTVVCYLKVAMGSDDDHRTHYEDKTLYKEKKNIREKFTLHANNATSVPFSVQMPDASLSQPEHKKLKKFNTQENQRNIRWSLMARVRCKGVDLNDEKNLVVPWIPISHEQAA